VQGVIPPHQPGAEPGLQKTQVIDFYYFSGIGTVSALDRGNAANVTPNIIGAIT
jgi:hypothetical protein